MKKWSLLIIVGLALLPLACSRGPEPPVLIQPTDNFELINIPFIWHPSPEATEYLFEIDQYPTFGAPVIAEVLKDTVYSIPSHKYEMFIPGGTYYWHVYAGDGENWGEASETRSFTTSTGGKPSPGVKD